jgi:hypothetical protein
LSRVFESEPLVSARRDNEKRDSLEDMDTLERGVGDMAGQYYAGR